VVVVRVSGSQPLSVELVHRALRSAGVTLSDDGRPRADVVNVLVNPAAADWAAAADRRVPTVVVSDAAVDEAQVADAVLRGADAVLATESGPEAVARAIEIVSEGGVDLTPSEMRAVADRARAAGGTPDVCLTPRETDILVSIAAGRSVKQTARALGIATKTVENLQGQLFRKLRSRNRAQAVARAHALGLLPLDALTGETKQGEANSREDS
jgi:DNA-binding NarL/FixJ family response regulator